MRDIVRSKTERELVRVKIHDGNAFWNKIGDNAGVSKLMLLSLNLLLPILVYATRHSLIAATAKAKTVNGERQIQALVDKKKVIITEKSVRSDFMLEDAERDECLPIGKEKGFSRRITPLFQTMMVQAPEDMGEDSTAPTDSHSTPIITQPSSSKPQKKKSRRKQRKDSGPTESIPNEATNEEPISTSSYDPPQSGEDRLQLTELMSLWLKRLRKVGSASRVESFNDVSLGAQEDASKQGRKIADLGDDAEVTLVDETQERNDEDLMFDTDVLNGDEVFEELIVNGAKTTSSFPISVADPVTTAGEVVTTASATTTVDELTLAQTLIEIKAAKSKAVITAATTITTAIASTRPKAKGIVFHDQEEQAPAFTPIVSYSQASQLLQAKDKGKAKWHIEIVKDDEVSIDAIPLATKPPMIVKYKIVKEGKFGYFQLIRADGSSKRYLSMIKMLQNIDREYLETLWKLVKAKHRNTRPEEDYRKRLRVNLKVMFEPDIKSKVWRSLQGYKVTI
ncbi:hypothetical protein Tco_0493313 [Tanacetum coccineum]